MAEQILPSGLVLSTDEEWPERKVTSAVPPSMCYVTGQMCRDLAAMARDPELALYPDTYDQEVYLLNNARQSVIAACGRACSNGCRLPVIDAGLKSKIELQLDISSEDTMALLGILKYVDESLAQEFNVRQLQPARGIVDGYVEMVCKQARGAGAKEFTNPKFTDKYCASFAGFSGPNFHVVKLVTHSLTTISYGQQTDDKLLKSEPNFELADPLNIDEHDLKRYLIGLDPSTSYALNLKSTERSDMFGAYA